MTAPRHRILLTDGDQRVTLALVRAFGAQGHDVVVGGMTERSMAAASRFAAAGVVLTDPLKNPTGFVQDVRDAVNQHGCSVLLPVSEAALYAILGAKDRFADVLIPVGAADRFGSVSDKIAVIAAAAEVGIAVPKSIVVASAEEAEALDTVLPPPFVIKPGRSVVASNGHRLKVAVRYAECRPSLRDRLRGLVPGAYPLMIQERIVGPGIGVFALRWGGQVHALFAHQRLREKPPSGGVSVYCESIPLDDSLRDQVVRLLERLDWDGVAMVEFKVDEQSGLPHLMEINGRFWGSLQLAVDAGVDFPNLLLAAAQGYYPQSPPSWNIGVRSRWWWGDVDHLITRFRRTDRELGLPSNAPSRWAALGEWLRFWRPGDRSDVFRVSDPKPFVRETVDWFTAALRRT